MKQLNSTVHPETGFSPLELLHGKYSPSSESPFHQPPPEKLYPLLQNFKTLVEDKRQETTTITEFLRNEMQIRKIEMQQRLNKNKVTTTFNVGDYCFIKDRSITVGVNPSLRTFYHPDPHIVLQDRPTTVVVRRLADSFQSVYSKDDVKKYNRLDATFIHLPKPVREILVNTFENLNKLDFNTIQTHAKLTLPKALNLTDEKHQDDTDNNADLEELALQSLEDIPVLEEDNQPISTSDKILLPSNINSDNNPKITTIPELDQTPINSTTNPSTPNMSTFSNKPGISTRSRRPKQKHRHNTRANPVHSDSESSEEENLNNTKQVTFSTNK